MVKKVMSILTLIALLGLPVIMYFSIIDMPNDDKITENEILGKRFYPFELDNFYGDTVRLEQYKGNKKVLLMLWHAACPYCKIQMENFEILRKEFSETELAILSIATGHRPTVKAFVDSHPFSYPVLMEDSLFREYLLHELKFSVPAVYLLDEDGVVCYSRFGLKKVDFDRRILKEFLKSSKISIGTYGQISNANKSNQTFLFSPESIMEQIHEDSIVTEFITRYLPNPTYRKERLIWEKSLDSSCFYMELFNIPCGCRNDDGTINLVRIKWNFETGKIIHRGFFRKTRPEKIVELLYDR